MHRGDARECPRGVNGKSSVVTPPRYFVIRVHHSQPKNAQHVTGERTCTDGIASRTCATA
jgi:hypothetical protein